LRCAIRVSSIGEDLFVHSAYPTVASDAVFFGPDTYRFVAAIRARMAPSERPLRRVADIGCGAGPGGVLVARQHPSAEVTLVDINPTALAYSKLNADLAGVRNVVAVQSDLLSGVDGSFDLIVSNPPYLNDPLARAYRHGGGALGEGLSLAIVREALGRLGPSGQLILYTGVAIVDGTDPFLTAISEHLQAAGMRWSYEELDPDVFGEELENESYGGVDRIAAVVLTAIREV
jgi:methylase of polypeptide subunit release factors